MYLAYGVGNVMVYNSTFINYKPLNRFPILEIIK